MRQYKDLNPNLRNPVVPFAARLEDVKPGVELMWAGYAHVHVNNVRVVTVGRAPQYHNEDDDSLCLFPFEARRDRWYLWNMGIIPGGDTLSEWNERALTIVNTSANRRELVDWLLRRGNPVAMKTAKEVAVLYPDDFSVVKTVLNRRGHPVLVVEVHDLLKGIRVEAAD